MPSTSDICWIALDAVGTVIFADPPVETVYCRIAQRFGSRLTDEDVRGRFDQAFRQPAWDRRQHSDPLTTSEEGERRRWRELVATVVDDISDPDAYFEELFAYFGRPDSWTCYPDVAEAVASLHAAGFRLAIASNFDSRLHAICNGLDELQPIDTRVISSLVGYRKPSERFYEALAESTGSPPERILMVGDDRLSDVEGARAAGLQAVHLDRAAAGSSGNERTGGSLRSPPAPHEVVADLHELAERMVRHDAT